MDQDPGIAFGMFSTLEEFHAALLALSQPDDRAEANARARQATLTKPPGSLGRLEEIAFHLAAWNRPRGPSGEPRADKIDAIVFAGNHGVTAQGISPYPADVTQQMVQNFKNGGAAINAVSSSFGLQLSVIPLELDKPTRDISEAPALEETELLNALNAGANAVSPDLDVVVLGEMGIGNTTIAAALSAASFGGDGRAWAGPGTGLNSTGVARKAEIIDRALALHINAKGDAIQIFRCLGGRETAAIAGAVVAARMARVPVILDGYVVCASIAPLYIENPDIIAHCLAGHLSAEPAHRRLLNQLGLRPILDLDMRLGEGTGAALAAGIVRAACAAHNNMATFDEAKVSQSSNGDTAPGTEQETTNRPVSAAHE